MAGRSAWRAAMPRRRQASPPSQRMHDFDAVAVFKSMLRMLCARHDGTVDLDRNAALSKTFARQEVCDGGIGFDVAYLAVELDLHTLIFARNSGWACGSATCER